MKVFNFFRRNKAPKQPDDPTPPEPRCHHYFMAHYALRQVALDNPLQYLAVLASDNAPRFLGSLLASVDKHCQTQGQKLNFSARDITVHPIRIKHYPCAIVQMPPPIADAEAYFTALVLLVDTELEDLLETNSISARYFTLELGSSLEGGTRTVVGEWHETGHLNYGTGPTATIEDFAARIAELV